LNSFGLLWLFNCKHFLHIGSCTLWCREGEEQAKLLPIRLPLWREIAPKSSFFRTYCSLFGGFLRFSFFDPVLILKLFECDLNILSELTLLVLVYENNVFDSMSVEWYFCLIQELRVRTMAAWWGGGFGGKFFYQLYKLHWCKTQ